MRRLVSIAAADERHHNVRPRCTTDLYQREIANPAELSEEVVDYLQLFNEIRPH
jgi:hypothetical protein